MDVPHYLKRPVQNDFYMAPDYIHSRFCTAFKRLMYMGAWTPDMLSKPKQKIYFYVCAFPLYIGIAAFIVLQFIDLYLVFGDFRKMTFNLCSSILVAGMCVKVMLLYRMKGRLTSLIYNLWKDSIMQNDDEDIAALDAAFEKLAFLRKISYASPITVLSWGIFAYFSYKWGPRLLPFAGYFPINDFNNDVTYLPALIFQVFIGSYVSQIIVETDLVMISIISQIIAHYRILAKNLRKLNRAFEGDERGISGKKTGREIDKHLRDDRIQREIKAIVKRHVELLKYCGDVTYIFSDVMTLQLSGGGLIILMNGVETARGFNDVTYLLGDQIIYLICVMADIYINFYFFTTLTDESVNLGYAVYDSGWYNMNGKTRKLLYFIMTRAKKPPKFNYCKLFSISVNSYMHLLKNIYSWMMLFRQLEAKN